MAVSTSQPPLLRNMLVWPTLFRLIIVSASLGLVSATSQAPAGNPASESHSLLSHSLDLPSLAPPGPAHTLLNHTHSPPPPPSTTITRAASPSHPPSNGHGSSTHLAASSSKPNATSSSHPVPTPTGQTAPMPNSTTASDIHLMTEKRLSFIVAGATNASDIPQWLSTLGGNGKWPDSEIDYTVGCDARPANWPAQFHWARILTMSSAWHGGLEGAEQYAKNSTLLAAVSRAMNFWFQNDFKTQACMDSGNSSACPCGTPGFWNTNWFSNIILIPNLVAQSCLLLNDSLGDSQMGNCTHITLRTYGTFNHTVNHLGIATGANLLDIAKIGIDQGLRVTNASIIEDAYNRIHNEVAVENTIKADGIRADGSFGQHSGIIYNGNYGKDFTNDVLFLEIIAGGTQFSAGETTRKSFETLISGDLWMIVRNVFTGVLHWDFSVLGRFISFPAIDDQATGSIKMNLTQIKQLGEVWDSDALTSAYDGLARNTSNANIGSIHGNRMFFTNDYMVQRGPGYITTLRMYSTRTKNTECLNNQNILGFHLSDGTLYTYMQGIEYEDIAAAWDWNLIPGTTVDYKATPLACSAVEHTGLHAFVGGASDGNIGAAAMRFTNPMTMALTFQKAWFFLDDDVQHVMIPVINSTSGAPVYSVLDQKRWSGPILVDGALPTGYSYAFTESSQASTLWHNNVGYTFGAPGPNSTAGRPNLTIEAGIKTGDWAAIGISTQGNATVDLFAAWLDHGSGPSFDPVSYTICPAVGVAEFRSKTMETRLQDVRNDQIVSAVYDSVHDTIAAVFWDTAGGSFEFALKNGAMMTITADGNVVVLYKRSAREVTVSDPSQTLAKAEITLTEKSHNTIRLSVTFSTGGLAGSSLTHKL